MKRLQRGQGAAEFLLAAVPVLMIGLGGIEAAHWYFVRQGVSLALAQAGRAAITLHADPVALDQAFGQALLPLYAGPTPAAGRARLQKAIARREHATGLPAWRIRIVSPSAASFRDFSSHDPDLPHRDLPIIDNDYLDERHQARRSQGWPEGRGPLSGQTTLEANTLVLHLTWLHEPLLPGVRQLLRRLAPGDTRYGSLAMSGAGYLPINRQVSLLMQSHAVAWPMPAHGRIMRLGGDEPAAPPTGPPSSYDDEPANWNENPRPGHDGDAADSHGPPAGIEPWPDAPEPGTPGNHLDSGDGGTESPAPPFDPDDCPGCCA